MFGYIRIAKPELRFKEYDYYKAVYCTLCKTMGRRYSRLTRLGLSYDFTFLALLELALGDDAVPAQKGRCVCNPCKRCHYLAREDACLFSATAAVLLMGCKAQDDRQDERGFSRLKAALLCRLLARPVRKARAARPDVADLCQRYLTDQHAVEQTEAPGIDRAAEPSAALLAALFAALSDEEPVRRTLSHLGMLLGRYVYVVDCLCDLPKDQATHAFNPLSHLTPAEAKTRMKPVLYAILHEAAATLELLPVKRCKNLLGNIIYVGLEDTLKKEIQL